MKTIVCERCSRQSGSDPEFIQAQCVFVSPVVQQLLTLAAVVLGAGGTFSATTLIERSKWRRNLDTRWDDKRLAAYEGYANALKKTHDVCQQLSAANGYPADRRPIDRDAGLRAYAEADAERTLKWEAVLLLGSPAAIAAARQWQKAIWEFRYFVLEEETDHARYLRLFEAMGRLRNEFYECARADLGIKSGTLPAEFGAWLPPGYSPPALDGADRPDHGA